MKQCLAATAVLMPYHYIFVDPISSTIVYVVVSLTDSATQSREISLRVGVLQDRKSASTRGPIFLRLAVGSLP